MSDCSIFFFLPYIVWIFKNQKIKRESVCWCLPISDCCMELIQWTLCMDLIQFCHSEFLQITVSQLPQVLAAIAYHYLHLQDLPSGRRQGLINSYSPLLRSNLYLMPDQCEYSKIWVPYFSWHNFKAYFSSQTSYKNIQKSCFNYSVTSLPAICSYNVSSVFLSTIWADIPMCTYEQIRSPLEELNLRELQTLSWIQHLN